MWILSKYAQLPMVKISFKKDTSADTKLFINQVVLYERSACAYK